MTLVIRNGTVVTASELYKADVRVRDGIISEIGKSLRTVEGEQEFDADGQYVMPGGIDVHTHLELETFNSLSADNFQTGTVAAAFGGTTSIVDFAPHLGGMSLYEAYQRRRAVADGNSFIDYSFHMMVKDLTSGGFTDLRRLADEGVTSFKLLMAYPGTYMVDDSVLYAVMRFAAEEDCLITVHAENGHVIQADTQLLVEQGNTAEHFHHAAHRHYSEGEAAHRAIALAELAGARLYIVHLSSWTALKEVEQARARNLPVWAETCPQYLFTAYEDYQDLGYEAAKYVCSPPIRERANQDPLWGGLTNGNLSTVATDHCPFRMKDDLPELPPQKSLGRGDFTKLPNGVPGIENRVELIYEGGVNGGLFDVRRFVDVVATQPAKIFGLYPRKGSIVVGGDADIVIWDPNKTHVISADTHHMRVDYNIYEGKKIRGNPSHVFSRGDLLVKDDTLMMPFEGRGLFMKRERQKDLSPVR